MRFAPGRAWRRFVARQIIAVRRPGFVWCARMRPIPLVWVDVLDAYVAGEGSLDARLFGCLRVARSAGAEAGRGELLRYLAELPWVPQALLHNPELCYRETGPRVVEVAANSRAGLAQVRLRFENGDVVRVEAGNRPRMLGRRLVPTPWAGCFYDYRDWNGWRIPMRAEAGWMLDAGMFVYWRGEITDYRSR